MTKTDLAPSGAAILQLDDRYAVTPCGRVLSRAFSGGVKGRGVSQGTVMDIKRGKSWSWLTNGD